MRRPFGRSLVVGVVATLADMAFLHFLVGFLGLAPTVANVPSLLLGVTLQFLGNKYWAFRDRSRDVFRQSALFALVEVGTFVLNALAFHALVASSMSLVAPVSVTVGPVVVVKWKSVPLRVQ